MQICILQGFDRHITHSPIAEFRKSYIRLFWHSLLFGFRHNEIRQFVLPEKQRQPGWYGQGGSSLA